MIQLTLLGSATNHTAAGAASLSHFSKKHEMTALSSYCSFSFSLMVDPFFLSVSSFASASGRSPHCGQTIPRALEYVLGIPHRIHILQPKPELRLIG